MSDVETCPIATKFCIIIREILVALALVCFVCNITVDFERALGSFRSVLLFYDLSCSRGSERPGARGDKAEMRVAGIAIFIARRGCGLDYSRVSSCFGANYNRMGGKEANFDMVFSCSLDRVYLLTLFLPPRPSPSSVPPFLFLPSFRQYSSRSLFSLFSFFSNPSSTFFR
jgi:hypothetical protein